MIKTSKNFLIHCTGEPDKSLVINDRLTRRNLLVLDTVKEAKRRRKAAALSLRKWGK
jgi:hypothetical protein